MNRVFSHLTVRTINEDQRLIEGWATTPSTDRVGDRVEPLGAEFDLPIPFLLDHDHTLAVGEVERAQVTMAGIRFVARIKKIPEEGEVKALVDRAWHLLKYGLRPAVSIGFRPRESEPFDGHGRRFTRWEWIELSAVTVPANADAVIESVKHARGGGVVRLDARSKAIGRIVAESNARIAQRDALGMKSGPISRRLTPAEEVEAMLRRAREKRTAARRSAGLRVIR